MNRAAKRRGIILGLVGVVLWAGWTQAYTPLLTAAGQEIRWPVFAGSAVTYQINQAGTTQISGVQERDAIRSSFATWQNVADSYISFTEGALTTALPGVADGQNVVGFVRNPSIFPSIVGPAVDAEVIGLTLMSVSSTGVILEADILLNDAGFVFSTTQETSLSVVVTATGALAIRGVVNLQNIVTHEVGHFCGLDHSYIDGNLQRVAVDVFGRLNPQPRLDRTATMYPFEFNGSTSRILKKDDEIGISHLYPETSFSTLYGTISGRVVSALNPSEPVFGAHVVAVGANELELVGILSRKDGSFLLDGLPAGSYRIFAEPIPFLSTAQDYFQTAEQLFPLEFYRDKFTPATATDLISVTRGQVTPDIIHTLLVGFPQIDENEPNNSLTEFTDANPDVTVTALISPERDRDFYRFRALRGSLIRVEVEAQRLKTALRPLIRIYNSNGELLEENQDFFGLGGDARIDFRVPSGGFYFVEVTSRDNAGGDGHFYRLTITAIEKIATILPESQPTAVLPFELTTSMVPTTQQLRLAEITVVFQAVPPLGRFTSSDLAVIDNSSNSGVSIYNDAGTRNGIFDANDQRIPLESFQILESFGQITIIFRLQASSVAVLRSVADGKPDFYVVVRTSRTLHLGDDFKVSIPTQGLLLMRTAPEPGTDNVFRQYRAFDTPIPKNPTIFVGELLEVFNVSEIEQRIPLGSIPIPLIGINAIGDPQEEYYLSQLKVLVVGYSAKNFVPFLIDRFRAVPAPETIVRATGSYGDFDLDDLKSLVTINEFQGGGIALYRDMSTVPTLGGFLGDGTFQPGTDPVVPFDVGEVREIPIRQIPADFLDPLMPRVLGVSALTFAGLTGPFLATAFDFATQLGIRAFEVTLELRETDLALIPSSNSASLGTLGADFFVAAQTSNNARALDMFMVLIPDEGIRIRNNFGFDESPTVDRPSLVAFDPGVGGQVVNSLTVRPTPFVEIDDLTKKGPANQVLELFSQGAAPKAIFGLNLADWGMSTHVIPQTQGIGDIGSFFNQGYIWDSLDVNFEAVQNFETTDLASIPAQTTFSPGKIFMDHGIAIYLDDDTPEGDFLDNDGDGLIDEEWRNGIDDDLDGVIDEADFGDFDGVGVNGVFDPLDYDNHWPPLVTRANRFVEFTNDAEYVTAPQFPVVPAPPGVIQAHFELLARRIEEQPLFRDVLDFIADPWTFSPQLIFLRTGFSPIWYDPLPTVNNFALTDPNALTQVGFYITLGDDEETFQPLIDLIADNEDFETTYVHAFPIPDEDGGAGREFLEGSDVFIVMRASRTAQSGDRFRAQLLANSIGMSVYQSSEVDLNNSYPITLPNAPITTEIVQFGGELPGAQITITAPSGQSFFDQDFSYEVRYTVTDPANTGVRVNLFLDNNNRGFDGILLNTFPFPVSRERFRFSLTDPMVFSQLMQRFGIVDVRRLTEQDQFYIYIEATDSINRVVRQYSNGFITVDERTLVNLASYIKLDREGVIYTTGLAGGFQSIPVKLFPAADLEVLPDENAVLVLRSDGVVYGRTLPGATLGPYEPFRRISFDREQDGRIIFDATSNVYFGFPAAVDIELFPEGPGYYILDHFGLVHTVGRNLRKFQGIYLSSEPVARDMELLSSGQGLYILTNSGSVFSEGDAPLFPLSTTLMLDAQDLLLSQSEKGYYVLNSQGVIGTAGDARRDFVIPGVTPGVDRKFRNMELSSDGKGLLVMDATGSVLALADVRLGSDPNTSSAQKFVDLEVVGLTAVNAEDLIRRYFEAFGREDIEGVLALTSDNYLDDHGNDRARLRGVLQTIFDYFLIGLPGENSFVIDNVEVQVASGQARVTAQVNVAYRVPTVLTMAPGDVTVLVVPFSQLIRIFELADGRNDSLEIYDISTPGGVFDPTSGRDRRIFSKTFTDKSVEGPWQVFLNYERPPKDSAYGFRLVDGPNTGGQLQPSDVRVVHYVANRIFATSNEIEFQFTLTRTAGGGFKIQSADVLQVLPTFAGLDSDNPVGFSFQKGGPIFEFGLEGGDTGPFLTGRADFLFNSEDGSILHGQTDYPGLVNLTQVLNITAFEQFRASQYRDIPLGAFRNTLPVVVDQIYLVMTRDRQRFGLIRPVRIETVDTEPSLVFDWKFVPEFVTGR